MPLLPFLFSMAFNNSAVATITKTLLSLARIIFYPFRSWSIGQALKPTGHGTLAVLCGKASLFSQKKHMKVCRHFPQAAAFAWYPYRDCNYILASACFNKTSDLSPYFDEDQITPQFGEINGIVTMCSFKPCVKHYGKERTKR